MNSILYAMQKRFLGIDYGEKRVGIAISDLGGRVAFPKDILPNNARLTDAIAEICEVEGPIEAVVIGESRDYRGEPNPIMGDIEAIQKRLEGDLGVPVHLEPEYLTTVQARRPPAPSRLARQAGVHSKDTHVDSSAAALILQSFLDKRKQNQ